MSDNLIILRQIQKLLIMIRHHIKFMYILAKKYSNNICYYIIYSKGSSEKNLILALKS